MIDENKSVVSNAGRQDALIVYIAYALSYLIGVGWIFSLIYAYLKRNDIQDTIYYSHMNYMIRTCWWTLLIFTISIITIPIIIGTPLLIASAIWSIYRLVKGCIAWLNHVSI